MRYGATSIEKSAPPFSYSYWFSITLSCWAFSTLNCGVKKKKKTKKPLKWF